MVFFIIFGIVMYGLGDETFQLFKIMCGIGLVWAILQKIAERAPIRRARRAERRRLRELRATDLFCDSDDEYEVELGEDDDDYEDDEQVEEPTIITEAKPVEPTIEEPTVIRKKDTDPRYFDVKELTIAQLQKRLNVLYSRMDKLKYVNGVDAETWEKCQKSKAYRGLVWDIDDTEERLERAIDNEKRRWTNA